MPSKLIIVEIEFMFLGINIFSALLRAHFNPRLTARAKMGLNRAQNIFMPAKINSIVLLDMSNPAPQKRKRAYRHRFKCSECEKEIVAEYQDARARTKHIRKKVKFTTSRAPNQSRLGFSGGDDTITSMVKCSKRWLRSSE